ncbi:MAG: hypothetical protein Q9195_002959 [Heterodermia aff. obscurata]
MAPKPKILLLGAIDHQPSLSAYNALSPLATLTTTTATNPPDFLTECTRPNSPLSNTLIIYRTFASISTTGPINSTLAPALRALGVRAICHCGAGYDQIDVSACSAAGIHVSNAPTAVDAATADTALYLLLGALRGFHAPAVSLREGKWRGDPEPALGHDPEGKVLGILGMGGIGRNLKAKAEALGMRVLYHNRREVEGEEEGYRGFEELLREVDVLSLNLPLNASTHHIISTPQFEIMKDSVVIINTARGGVIDEAALVHALDSGKVWSVGLDVYEDEPKVHPGLTQTKMELWTIDNVRSMLETGRLKSRVPEQKDMAYD